ncbi:LysM peptidoglycan-binding domain-containing protein [Phycisphaerales bacterium AB-hyl4]|uniref:LysM peptidoglycan-binding domain-containing protein n=1 Tax=Natronomicrosphaera hydrolytica TaxID=3242702 RepID=A0ABV4U878_9BACT
MRKLFSTLALVLGVSLLAGGMVGCQGQERERMAEVPPPAFDEAEDFEPVAVNDYDDEPVAVDPDEAREGGASDDEAASAGGTRYTIQRGDTLWSIANDHYGDGQRWREIVDANPNLNTERMPVGEEIRLPD